MPSSSSPVLGQPEPLARKRSLERDSLKSS
jgi:hypothetical protein